MYATDGSALDAKVIAAAFKAASSQEAQQKLFHGIMTLMKRNPSHIETLGAEAVATALTFYLEDAALDPDDLALDVFQSLQIIPKDNPLFETAQSALAIGKDLAKVPKIDRFASKSGCEFV